MSDVLLLHAEELQTQGFVGAMPPLGLAWLATSLEKAKVGVEILDRQVDPRSFAEVFRTARPAVLGISSTTAARFQAFEYAAEAKRLAPETVVVLGGPHATCTAQDTLAHLPQIDAVVVGEGEATLLDLTARILDGKRDLAGIPGLWCRHGEEILSGPPRPRERNLDNLGFPARHLLRNELYGLENEFIGGTAFHVMASRGCPHACTFCSAANIWGRRITFRTPRHVVDEMEQLRDVFGARGFRFMDALVTLRRDFVLELCAEIVDRRLNLPWECEVRVDTIDEEILRHMREAGCYYLDFGAESVSPRVLARMKKRITPEQISVALDLSHRLGFKTKVFFTFGHIEETLEDAEETLRYIRRHSREISRLGGGVGINIFPGTEVEEFARASGALPRGFSWSMPFDEPRNPYFATPPSVPLLIQPGFGWREMRIVRRHQLYQKMRDPRVILSNLRSLGGPKGLRRLCRLVLGPLRRGGESATSRHCPPPDRRAMNLLVEAIVAINRLFPRPRIYGRESPEAYSQWGYESGREVFERHFGVEVLKGARVLDVGCGAGGKTAWYAEAGAESVTGLDINPANAKQSRDFVARRGVEGRVRLLCGDAMRMPFADGAFSLVIANDCMEHFADPAAALHELGRVLEPDGRLCLYFTPYLSPLGSHLYDYIQIPWCHVLLPRKVLYATLQRLMLHAERKRDDGDADQRAAQRYRNTVRYFEHDVNGITVRRFHEIVESEPQLRARRIHYVVLRFGFLRPLTRIPLLREYLACLVFADLQRA